MPPFAQGAGTAACVAIARAAREGERWAVKSVRHRNMGSCAKAQSEAANLAPFSDPQTHK